MKFSTRARYGLRMMVELARLQRADKLVQLKGIAKITGLSMNYLGQLAIPLRDSGLIVGVSGKNGGYYLARSAKNITLKEIIDSVQGPICATDCVINPEICLNAEFCEARSVWSLITHKMQEILMQYSLADLVSKDWMKEINTDNPDNIYLSPKDMATLDRIKTANIARKYGCQ